MPDDFLAKYVASQTDTEIISWKGTCEVHELFKDEEINEMINEALISEMRVRDLNEISKVVIKEDFYTFINAGNNILRTMEEKGMGNGKKYLGYLVKHNIM